MTRTLASIMVLALLLAGCTDDPEPKFADPTSDPPTSEPTTSPTTSTPTSTPTQAPERLSPEETVRAWVDARNQLLRDGDPSAVDALSSTSCETCTELNRDIAAIYEAGGYFRTKGWIVEGARRKPDFRRSNEVATAIEFAGGVTLLKRGGEPRRYDAEKNFIDFTLTREGGVWLVGRVVFLA